MKETEATSGQTKDANDMNDDLTTAVGTQPDTMETGYEGEDDREGDVLAPADTGGLPNPNGALPSGTPHEDQETQKLVTGCNDSLDRDSKLSSSQLSVNVGKKKTISFRNLSLKPDDHPYPLQVRRRASMSRKDQAVLMKDLFIVSIAFMLLFSAFNGIQNMASSLFPNEGLGVISYSCYYTFGIVSCFLTPMLVKKFTPKWALVVCLVLTCIFLATLLYPRMYTVIPSSILLGFSNGPLWAAAALYVSNAGFEYASQTGKTVGPVIARFHGIWMLFQQMSQVFGNLLSSLIFQYGSKSKPDYDYGRVCGASQCPLPNYEKNRNGKLITVMANESMQNFTSALAPPVSLYIGNVSSNITAKDDSETLNKIYILGGVYIGLVAIGIVLVGVFLGKFRASAATWEFGSTISMASIVSTQQSIHGLLFSTLILWKKSKLLLLLPMAYVTGMHQGYLYADFTQAYISCTIGISWVGYTMICYGVMDVIFCYIVGKLNKVVGRIVLFTVAFVIHIAIILTLILWSPTPDSLVPFFVIPGLWGICDAVWQPQTTALLSTMFPREQEASFANYRLLHNLGFAVTFGYSQALCINTKFYIFLAILTFAFICYLILEVRLRNRSCFSKNAKEPAADAIIIQPNRQTV